MSSILRTQARARARASGRSTPRAPKGRPSPLRRGFRDLLTLSRALLAERQRSQILAQIAQAQESALAEAHQARGIKGAIRTLADKVRGIFKKARGR